MPHERTWEKSYRDVVDCRETLLRIDAHSLERRASRLSKIPCIQSFDSSILMPSWTWKLLDEAEGCYVDGNYTGCIVSLAAGVEHGLRELCDGRLNDGLGELITIAAKNNQINQSEIESLENLNRYRNDMAHSRIDSLSDGLKMQRGWVVYDPQNQSEKEILIRFAAESKVEGILFGVREAVYDIFDRNQWKSKESDVRS